MTAEQLDDILKSVKHLAIKYGHRLKSDWVQELQCVGNLAVVKAALEYAPNDKYSLKNHCTNRARTAMIDFLRAYGPLKCIRQSGGKNTRYISFVSLTPDKKDTDGIWFNDPQIKRLL